MPNNPEESPEKNPEQPSEAGPRSLSDPAPELGIAVKLPPIKTPEDECRERLGEIERDLYQLQGWILEVDGKSAIIKRLLADDFADLERRLQEARIAFDGGAWEQFWYAYGQFKGVIRTVLMIIWRLWTGDLTTRDPPSTSR